MYCQVCGTQLPSEARACPKCGTLTPASSANASASPYDPTIPAVSGASPSVMRTPPLPPTQYGANPYDSSLQSPYPVNPYEVPPPPPPRRKGNRIGIIVGVVLLALLLIGGGVFAWLRFFSTPTFTANGTFTILNTTTTNTQHVGQNTIYSYIQQGADNGDVTGTYTDEETFTLHPDGTGAFSGTATCTCTVEGKSGTYTYSFNGTSKPDGSFQGQLVVFQGTGDLANLRGQGEFQGKGNQGTFSSQDHF